MLKASVPLTLASIPTGFLPWFATDLARTVHGAGKGRRAVIVAADETAMRAIADTVQVEAGKRFSDARPDALQCLDFGEQGIKDFRAHRARP